MLIIEPNKIPNELNTMSRLLPLQYRPVEYFPFPELNSNLHSNIYPSMVSNISQ